MFQLLETLLLTGNTFLKVLKLPEQLCRQLKNCGKFWKSTELVYFSGISLSNIGCSLFHASFEESILKLSGC